MNLVSKTDTNVASAKQDCKYRTKQNHNSHREKQRKREKSEKREEKDKGRKGKETESLTH